MRVAVAGGTGRVGSKLVSHLRERGHLVSVLSRRDGVDTIARQGLEEALAAAEVVVDVIGSPSQVEDAARWYLDTSTRNLLAAELAAGVRHHVCLSILGADRIHAGIFRAKRAQEDRVRGGGVPYTIVRSAPFFESLREVADAATHGGLARVAPIRIQPIAIGDVAAALTRTAIRGPVDGTVSLAGPESFDLEVLMRRLLAVEQDHREVLPVHWFRFMGAELSEGSESLLPDLRVTGTRFEDWLATGRTGSVRTAEDVHLSRGGVRHGQSSHA